MVVKKISSEQSEILNEKISSEPDPAYARRVKIIFENLELSGNERVIDIGCGRGFYLKLLNSLFPELDIYGVDMNENYLEVAKKTIKEKSIKITAGDANNLNFKSNFFDRIIASEVLEHIKTDEVAMKEIYRVLKPGGTALITVPNKNYSVFWDPINWILERFFGMHIRPDVWWLAGIWADHQRLYRKKELLLKLKNAGFKIEKVWLSTKYCFPFSHYLFYGVGMILVEKGFFKSFNRFEDKPKHSLFNKIVLSPIRAFDKINSEKINSNVSVNIVVRAKKD